ncbi:MAG: hypothetical protein ACKV2Q_13585 [Planctomycetaceae bacterium]
MSSTQRTNSVQVAPAWLTYLRTPRGQLSITALLYFGAAVLAASAVLFRPWFDRTVREKFPEVAPKTNVAQWRTLANDIASGKASAEDLVKWSDEQLLVVYGVWLDETECDPKGRLADVLVSQHRLRLVPRVRQTLAVGSRVQRLRALALLQLLADAKLKDEAMNLARFAWERGRRRGEPDVVEKCAVLIRNLESLLSEKDDAHE